MLNIKVPHPISMFNHVHEWVELWLTINEAAARDKSRTFVLHFFGFFCSHVYCESRRHVFIYVSTHIVYKCSFASLANTGAIDESSWPKLVNFSRGFCYKCGIGRKDRKRVQPRRDSFTYNVDAKLSQTQTRHNDSLFEKCALFASNC